MATTSNVISVTFDAQMTGMEQLNQSMQSIKAAGTAMESLHAKAQTVVNDFVQMGKAGNQEFEALRTQTADLSHEIAGVHQDIVETGNELNERATAYQKMKQEAGSDERKNATAESYRRTTERWAERRAAAIQERAESVMSTSEMFGISQGQERGMIGSKGTISASVFDIKAEQMQIENFTQQYRKMMAKWAPTMRGMISKAMGTVDYSSEDGYRRQSLDSTVHNLGIAIRSGFQKAPVGGTGNNTALTYGTEMAFNELLAPLRDVPHNAGTVKNGELSRITGLSKQELEMLKEFSVNGAENPSTDDIVRQNAFKTMLRQAIIAKVGATNTSLWAANRGGDIAEIPSGKDIDFAYFMKGTGLEGFFDTSKGGVAAYEDKIKGLNIAGNKKLTEAGAKELAARMAKSPMMMRALLTRTPTGQKSEIGSRTHTGSLISNILDTEGLLQLGDNLVSEFLVRGNGQIDTLEVSPKTGGVGPTKLMKHLMTKGAHTNAGDVGENIRYNGTRYGGQTDELIDLIREGYSEIEHHKQDSSYVLPTTGRTGRAIGIVNRLRSRLKGESTVKDVLASISNLDEFLTHEEYFTNDDALAAQAFEEFVPANGVREKQTQYLSETLFPFLQDGDKRKDPNGIGNEFSKNFKLHFPAKSSVKYDPLKPIKRSKETQAIPSMWRANNESGISRALGLSEADQNERNDIIKEISMEGVDPVKGMTDLQKQQLAMLLEDAGVYHLDPKTGKLTQNNDSEYVFHMAHGQSGVTARLIRRKEYQAAEDNFADLVATPMALRYGLIDPSLKVGTKEAREATAKYFGTFWNNLSKDKFNTGEDYSGSQGIPDFSKMFDNRGKRWSPGIDLFGTGIDWVHGGIDVNGNQVSFEDVSNRIRNSTGANASMAAPRVKVVDLATFWKKQYDYSKDQYIKNFDPAERQKLIEKQRIELLKNSSSISADDLKKKSEELADAQIKQMAEAQLEKEGIREKAYGFDSALEGEAIADASMMSRGAFQGRGGLAGKGTVSSMKDMIRTMARSIYGKNAGTYNPYTGRTTYSVDLPSAFGKNGEMTTLWSEYDQEGNMVASNADMIVDKSMQKDYKNLNVFRDAYEQKLKADRDKGIKPEYYTPDERKKFRENATSWINESTQKRIDSFEQAYKSGTVRMQESEYQWATKNLEDSIKKYTEEGESGKVGGLLDKMTDTFLNDETLNPEGDFDVARRLARKQLAQTKLDPLRKQLALVKGAWNLQSKKDELARLEQEYSEEGFAGSEGGLLGQLTDKYMSDVAANPKLSKTVAQDLARSELATIREQQTKPLRDEIAEIEKTFGSSLHFGDFYNVLSGDTGKGLKMGIQQIRDEAIDEYAGTYDPVRGHYYDKHGQIALSEKLEDKIRNGEYELSDEMIAARARDASDEAMSAMYAINGMYSLADYKDDKKAGGIGAQASQWLRFSPGVMRHQAEAYNQMMDDLKTPEGIRKLVFGSTGNERDSFMAQGLSGPGATAFMKANEEEINTRVENFKKSMLMRTMNGEFVDYASSSGDQISSSDSSDYGIDIANRRFVTNAWMARNINLGINENEKSLEAWTQLMEDPNAYYNLQYDKNGLVTDGYFKGRSKADITEGRSRIDIAKQAFEKSAGRKFDYRQILGIMTLAGYGKEGDADYLPGGYVDFTDFDSIAGAIQRSPTGFDQLVAGLNYAAIGLGPGFKELTHQDTGIMLNMTDMQRLAGGDWDGDMVKRLLSNKYSLARINELRKNAETPLPELTSSQDIFKWVTSKEGFETLRNSGKVGGTENSIVDDVFNTIELVKQVGLFSDKDKQGLGSSKDQMEDETDLKNKIRASEEKLKGVVSIDMVDDINRRIVTPAQMGLTSAIGSRLSSIDLTDPKNAFWAKIASQSNRLYDVYTTQAKRPHDVDLAASNFSALSLGQEWGKMAKLTEGMWDVKQVKETDANGQTSTFFTTGQGERIDPSKLYVSEHGYGVLDTSKGNLGGRTTGGAFKLDTTQFMSRTNRMNVMEAVIAQAAQERGNLDPTIAEFYKELYTKDVQYRRGVKGDVLLDSMGHGILSPDQNGNVGGIGFGIFDYAKRADGSEGLQSVKKLMKNARGIRAYQQGGMHMILDEADRYALQQQLYEAGEEIDRYVQEQYAQPGFKGFYKIDDEGNYVTDKQGEKVRLTDKQYAAQLRRQAGFEQVKMLIGATKKTGDDGKEYFLSTGMTVSGLLDTLANSGDLGENSILARMLLSTMPKDGSALIDDSYDIDAARSGAHRNSKDKAAMFASSKSAMVRNARKLGVEEYLPDEIYGEEKQKQEAEAQAMKEQAKAAAEEKKKAAEAAKEAQAAAQGTPNANAQPNTQTGAEAGAQAAAEVGAQAAEATQKAAETAAQNAAEQTAQAAETAAEQTAQAAAGNANGENSASKEGLNSAIARGMDQHTVYEQMAEKWQESMQYVSRAPKNQDISLLGLTTWKYKQNMKNTDDLMTQYTDARDQLTAQEASGHVDSLLQKNVEQMQADLPKYIQGIGYGAYNSTLKAEEQIGDIIGKGQASGAINKLKSLEDTKKEAEAKVLAAEAQLKEMRNRDDWEIPGSTQVMTDEKGNPITSFAEAEHYVSEARTKLESIKTTYENAYGTVMNSVIAGLNQQTQSINQSISGVTKQPFAQDAESKQQRVLKSMADIGTQIVQQRQAITEAKETDAYKTDKNVQAHVDAQEKELEQREKEYGKGDKDSDLWKQMEAKDTRDAYEYAREHRDNGVNDILSNKYKFDQMINPSQMYDAEAVRTETLRQQMMQANASLISRRKMVDARVHDARYTTDVDYWMATESAEEALNKDEELYGTGDENSALWQQLAAVYDQKQAKKQAYKLDSSKFAFALQQTKAEQMFYTNEELGLDDANSETSIEMAVAQAMQTLAQQISSERQRLAEQRQNDPKYAASKAALDAHDKINGAYAQQNLDEDAYWAQMQEAYNNGTAQDNFRKKLARQRKFERDNSVDYSMMSYDSMMYNYGDLLGTNGPKFSDEDMQNRIRSKYMAMGNSLNQQNKMLRSMKKTDAYKTDAAYKQKVDDAYAEWQKQKEDYDKGEDSDAWANAEKMNAQEVSAQKNAQRWRDKASLNQLEKQSERYTMQERRYNNQFLSGNIFGQVYQRMDNRREQIRMQKESAETRQYQIKAQLAEMEQYRGTSKFDTAHEASLYAQLSQANKDQRELESQESRVSGVGGYLSTFAKTVGGNLLSTGINKALQSLKKLGKEAIQFANQWNTAMQGVSAKSGLTGDALQQMGDKIESQATRLKVSSTTLANTYKQLFAAGFDESNVEDAAEVMTKFSTVTGQDVTKSIRQLSQVVKSGLVGSLDEAMDSLTAISDLSTSSVADISKVLSKMSGSAVSSGMSSSEAMGLAAYTTDILGGSASAGNDLNLIINRMSQLTEAGTSTASVFTDSEGRKFSADDLWALQKTTGVNFMSSDQTSLLSPLEMMKNIAAQWQTLTDSQRNSFTTIFGGSSGRQSNTFTSLMNSMSLDPDLLDTYVEASENSSGTVDYQYNTMMDTAKANWQQAKSAFTDAVSDFFGGSDGWFASLSSTLAKGVTALFGGVEEEIPSISLDEVFDFNMSNLQEGIDAIQDIKDKYTDLNETLSDEDQADIAANIKQIGDAFPSIATKADQAVTTVAQLVELLKLLNTEKEKLISDNAEEARDLADYDAITKKFKQDYAASDYNYAVQLSSSYAPKAATNWKNFAINYMGKNMITVDGDNYDAFLGYALREAGKYLTNPIAYNKYGSDNTSYLDWNRADKQLKPMLTQMASGELTYENMTDDQRSMWDKYMEAAYNYIVGMINDPETDYEQRIRWQATKATYFPHAKTSAQAKAGKEAAVSDVVDSFYETVFGTYEGIDETAETYFKSVIKDYFTSTYDMSAIAKDSNFKFSSDDSDKIWDLTKKWFYQGLDSEGNAVYGSFNKTAFEEANAGSYATYWYNGTPLLGTSREDAAKYYQQKLKEKNKTIAKQNLAAEGFSRVYGVDEVSDGTYITSDGRRGFTGTKSAGSSAKANGKKRALLEIPTIEEILQGLTTESGESALTTLSTEIGAANASSNLYVEQLGQLLKFFSQYGAADALNAEMIEGTSWEDWGLESIFTTYSNIKNLFSTYKSSGGSQAAYNALTAEVEKQYLAGTTGSSTDLSTALSNFDTVYAKAQKAAAMWDRYQTIGENGERAITSDELATVKAFAGVATNAEALDYVDDYVNNELYNADITYDSVAAMIEAELNSVDWGGETVEERIKNAEAQRQAGSTQAQSYINAWQYLQRYNGKGLGYTYDEETGKFTVTGNAQDTSTELDVNAVKEANVGFDYSDKVIAAPYLRRVLAAGSKGLTSLEGVDNQADVISGLTKAYGTDFEKYWELLGDIDKYGFDKLSPTQQQEYQEYKIKLSFSVNGLDQVTQAADTVSKITTWAGELSKGGTSAAKAEGEIATWNADVSKIYGIQQLLQAAGGDVSKMEPVAQQALLSSLQNLGFSDLKLTDLTGENGSWFTDVFNDYATGYVSDWQASQAYIAAARENANVIETGKATSGVSLGITPTGEVYLGDITGLRGQYNSRWNEFTTPDSLLTAADVGLEEYDPYESLKVNGMSYESTQQFLTNRTTNANKATVDEYEKAQRELLTPTATSMAGVGAALSFLTDEAGNIDISKYAGLTSAAKQYIQQQTGLTDLQLMYDTDYATSTLKTQQAIRSGTISEWKALRDQMGSYETTYDDNGNETGKEFKAKGNYTKNEYDILDQAIQAAETVSGLVTGMTSEHYISNIDEVLTNLKSGDSATRASAVSTLYQNASTMDQTYAFAQQIYQKAVTEGGGIASLSPDELSKLMTETGQSYTSITGTNGLDILTSYVNMVNGNMDNLANDLIQAKIAQMQQAFNAADTEGKKTLKQQYKDLGFKFVTDESGNETDQIDTDISGVDQTTLDAILAAYGYTRTQEYEDPNSQYGFSSNTMKNWASASGFNAASTKATALSSFVSTMQAINEAESMLGSYTSAEEFAAAYKALNSYEKSIVNSAYNITEKEVNDNEEGAYSKAKATKEEGQATREEMLTGLTGYAETWLNSLNEEAKKRAVESGYATVDEEGNYSVDIEAFAEGVSSGDISGVSEEVQNLADSYTEAGEAASSAATGIEAFNEAAEKSVASSEAMQKVMTQISQIKDLGNLDMSAAIAQIQGFVNALGSGAAEMDWLETLYKYEALAKENGWSTQEMVSEMLYGAGGYTANVSEEDLAKKYEETMSFFNEDYSGWAEGKSATDFQNYWKDLPTYMQNALTERYSFLSKVTGSSWSDSMFDLDMDTGLSWGAAVRSELAGHDKVTRAADFKEWMANRGLSTGSDWYTSGSGNTIAEILGMAEGQDKIDKYYNLGTTISEIDNNISAYQQALAALQTGDNATFEYWAGKVTGLEKSKIGTDEGYQQYLEWLTEQQRYQEVLDYFSYNGYSDAAGYIRNGRNAGAFNAEREVQSTLTGSASTYQQNDWLNELTSQLTSDMTKEQIADVVNSFYQEHQALGSNSSFMDFWAKALYDQDTTAADLYNSAMTNWNYDTKRWGLSNTYFSDSYLEDVFTHMQEGTEAGQAYIDSLGLNETQRSSLQTRLQERYGDWAKNWFTYDDAQNYGYESSADALAALEKAKITAQQEDNTQAAQRGTYSTDAATFVNSFLDSTLIADDEQRQTSYLTQRASLIEEASSYNTAKNALSQWTSSKDQDSLSAIMQFLTAMGVSTSGTEEEVRERFAQTKLTAENTVSSKAAYFKDIWDMLNEEQRTALFGEGVNYDDFFQEGATGGYSSIVSAEEQYQQDQDAAANDLYSEMTSINDAVEAGTMTEDQGREQMTSFIGDNANVDAYLDKMDEINEIMKQYKSGTLNAAQATLKLQKAMSKDAKATAELSQKMTKLNKEAMNYQYFIEKSGWTEDDQDEAAKLAGYKDWQEATDAGETEATLRARFKIEQEGTFEDITDLINDQLNLTGEGSQVLEVEGPEVLVHSGTVTIENAGDVSTAMSGASAAAQATAAKWASMGYIVTYDEYEVWENGQLKEYGYIPTTTQLGSGSSGASPAGSSGGGGGGGGGKSKSQKVLEKWKHKVTAAKHVINMAKAYEEYYQETGHLAQYGTELSVEKEAQADYIQTQKKAIAAYKEQLNSLGNSSKQAKFSIGSYIGDDDQTDWYDLTEAIQEAEEEIVAAETAIKKINKALEENRTAMRKTRTDLESYLKDIIEANEKYDEEVLAGTVEMEDTILEALKQRYQDEWDLQKEDLEKKKEALEEEKELISERLQARKDAEDESASYEELSQLQKQMAILALDQTQSAKLLELQQQYNEKANKLAWSQTEDFETAQEEALDDEIEGIEQYIEDTDEYVEDYLEDANNFSEAVKEVLGGTQDEIIQWLKDNVDEYDKYLTAAQEQQVEKWLDTYKQMMGITDTYWEQINAIIQGGWTAVAQTVMTSQDYITASDTDKIQMLRDAKDKYDEYKEAYAGSTFTIDNFDTLTDTYLTQMEEAIANGDTSTLSKLLKSYSSDMTASAEGLHTDSWTTESTAATKENTKAIKDLTTTIQNGGASTTAVTSAQQQAAQAAAQAAVQQAAAAAAAQQAAAAAQTWTQNAADLITNIKDNVSTWWNGLKNKLLLGGGKVESAADGGVFNYTGQVTVHGTNEHPEYIFNEDQLKALSKIGYVPYASSIGTDVFGNTSNSIGDVSIVINQAEIASDVDIEKLAEQVGDQFLNQISTKGYRTGRF